MYTYHNNQNQYPTPFMLNNFDPTPQTTICNKPLFDCFDPQRFVQNKTNKTPIREDFHILREKNCSRNTPSKSPQQVAEYSYLQRTKSRIEELQGIINDIQANRNSGRTPEVRDLYARTKLVTPLETTPMSHVSPINFKRDDYSPNHPNNMETWLNQKSDVGYKTKQYGQYQEKSRMLTPPMTEEYSSQKMQRLNSEQKFSDLFSRYIHSSKKPPSPKFTFTDEGRHIHKPSVSPIQRKPPQTAQQPTRHPQNEPTVADFDFQINQYIKDDSNSFRLQNNNQRTSLTNTFIVNQKNVSPAKQNFIQQPKQLVMKSSQKNENQNISQISSIVSSVLPENMIVDNLDNYQMGKVLGLGSYAVVRQAIHKPTGQKMAIKTYEKNKITDPQKRKNVTREMKILSKLRHNSIIKLYQAGETNSQLHLIMEYSSSNSLNTFIKSRTNRRLCEGEARIVFKQIADAIKYCHHKNVVHRDIKLENILVDDKRQIKLIDFGFSIAIDPSNKLNVFCGTPSYMAPEIVNKIQYSFPADIWALGILLFKMVTGTFPFKGVDDKELYKSINTGKIEFPIQLGFHLRLLIQKMLKVNQNERPTAKEILQDEWFYLKSNNSSEEEGQRI